MKETKAFIAARKKGFDGDDSFFQIKEWLLNEHKLYAEIFFSMFHKTWSINNYFIDLKKCKKVEWDYTNERFVDYYDALEVSLIEMLKKV